jgi:SAM-dependent methyltransferase
VEYANRSQNMPSGSGGGFLTRLKGLGGDRGPYIRAVVPDSAGRVLDIGCSYGWTLGALTGKANTLVGIDMDTNALAQARISYPDIQFIHQTATTLPFPDQSFDVVILSEVIEHVGDENKQQVIDEAHRVLKEGGLFIFTAPYAGLFAWADPMDFKRRCSGLYRLYMKLARYTPSTPIEIGHKHVSLPEIERLFAGRFDVGTIRYCGLLMPALTWVLSIGPRLRLLPRSLEDTINRFRGWESGVRVPRLLAFNVRLTATKKERV